jgi:methylmalonyl-CoA mutase cobalamin-binding subunit
VPYVTDTVGTLRHDRGMDVLVTITVLDDEGEEIDTASASAETPEEAFELALEQLELESGD